MTRTDAPLPSGVSAPAEASATSAGRGPTEHRVTAARVRHRLVVLSILLVAGALATMLNVQFETSPTAAILIGAFAAATFLLVHGQVVKAGEIARLKKELTRTQAAGSGRNSPLASQEGERGGSASPSAEQPSEPNHSAAALHPLASERRRRAGVGDAQQRTQASGVQQALTLDPLATVAPAHPAAPQRGSDPLRDQWAFRPREPLPTATPPVAHVNSSGPAPTYPIESDLALVQRKIKALADEVNATDARQAPAQPFDLPLGPPSAALQSSIDALKKTADAMRERPQPHVRVSGSPREPARTEPPQPSPQPAKSPFHEFSIPATAQRIAASSPEKPAFSAVELGGMFPDLPATFAPAPARSAHAASQPNVSPTDFHMQLPDFFEPRPTHPQPSPRMQAIVEAVDAGRMDALLSPIVGLQRHDVCHYELKVRLKSEAGDYFDDAEAEMARAGGDLLAAFDAARLQRAAAMARRLEAKGKGGSLLSDAAGASLSNGMFLDMFARMHEEREGIAGQLVLTILQADCERLGDAWATLQDMHSFGFRFALDRVSHLDIDFSELAQRGFAFVRLDAPLLLNGAPGRDGLVSPDDVCARIAAAGLTLIVEGVDSDAARAKLLALGVQFGQGLLFGGARRVSADPSAAASSAAA